ncbi:VirK family protein [Phyllobacterium phragmitis]|nr:VirK family protein [Phyllobacterium phragmitis]
MSAQASEFAHTFSQLKAALLDVKQVTAVLDLKQCQDAKGTHGPDIHGGFLIPSFMIIENQGTPRIAFSLSHETVGKQTNQLRHEFVRYTVMSNNRVSVDTFWYVSGAPKATPVGSWTCHIGKGIRFGW